MGGLVYLDWQSRHCHWSYEFLASWGDCLARLRFLICQISWRRSHTSVAACPGPSLTLCHISTNGSYSLQRFLHHRSNGSAPNKSFSLTSQFSFQLWVCMTCWFSRFQDAYFMKIWLFHPLAESFGMATWQVPFPSWKTIVPQILFFFFFEDLFHFLGMCLSLKYLWFWP